MSGVTAEHGYAKKYLATYLPWVPSWFPKKCQCPLPIPSHPVRLSRVPPPPPVDARSFATRRHRGTNAI